MEYQKHFWEEDRARRSPENCVVEAFAKNRIMHILNHIELDLTKKVLDIGCGNGFFTYHFSRISNTVGLDYSGHMLSINPCEKLIQGSANLLPFKDCVFDMVFCSSLLHHIEEPTRVVAEMKRVSNRYVVFFEPNRDNPLVALFSAMAKEERHALRFSKNYLKSIVEKNDLKIIEACSFGCIAPNKTPKSLIMVLKFFDRKMPFGLDNLIISQK